MRSDPRDLLRRFEPWRPRFEWGYWIVVYAANAVANSINVSMDMERRGIDVAGWEPALWETSSAATMLLLVWPVVRFTRRIPLTWRNIERAVAIHAGASVVYSLLHVLIMVAIREIAYAAVGADYSFGHWSSELFYEYLKDARSYAGVVVTIEVYRFVLRRLRGEARWLDAPDPGHEPEPQPARPERFLVKMLGREFLVPADRIEYASAAANYVNLHVDGRDYPLRSTLKDLLQHLDPGRFLRIHRSHIVNLDHVRQIQPTDSGDARIDMSDGASLPCSRAYRTRLLDQLQMESRP